MSQRPQFTWSAEGGLVEGGRKVLVICRNRPLQQSIARTLIKKTDFEVVGARATDPASLGEVVDSGTDVLVLDSVELLADAGNLNQSLLVRCVLVAMEDNHDHFLTAIRHGARGYVLQDASAAEVVSAVRMVAHGQAVYPPEYARLLLDLVRARAEDLPNSRRRAQWGLSRREQQLIPLIGRGLSNREIADHFTLSEQTVKNHIYRIMRKMGVSDRLSIFEACRDHTSEGATEKPTDVLSKKLEHSHDT
jgi:two-component system response regulator DevR